MGATVNYVVEIIYFNYFMKFKTSDFQSESQNFPFDFLPFKYKERSNCFYFRKVLNYEIRTTTYKLPISNI